jgi:hypothetical protein
VTYICRSKKQSSSYLLSALFVSSCFLFLFPVVCYYVFRRFVAKGVKKHGGEKINKTKHRGSLKKMPPSVSSLDYLPGLDEQEAGIYRILLPLRLYGFLAFVFTGRFLYPRGRHKPHRLSTNRLF